MSGGRDGAGPELAQRVAELTGVLCAVYVPREAHDAGTLALIAGSEHASETVMRWLITVADRHLRMPPQRTPLDPAEDASREHGDDGGGTETDSVLDVIPVGPFARGAKALELTHVATQGWTRAGDHPESLALMRAYLLARLGAAGVELGEVDHQVLTDVVEELRGPAVEVIGGWLARVGRS